MVGEPQQFPGSIFLVPPLTVGRAAERIFRACSVPPSRCSAVAEEWDKVTKGAQDLPVESQDGERERNICFPSTSTLSVSFPHPHCQPASRQRAVRDVLKRRYVRPIFFVVPHILTDGGGVMRLFFPN